MDIRNRKKKEDLLYDIGDASCRIFTWKAHILATVHREMQKMDILENLSYHTAFLIVDFAMKFLAQQYHESMAKWLGKAGMGMHIACVIVKDQEENLKKRKYVVFFGNASQDTATVIAIYQRHLEQIKTDFLRLNYIKDKSDNAGCYHNEILFSWKTQWPRKKLGLQFEEKIFNEHQSGKDQCDRDAATAKRQMNYFIERGRNIETAYEMNEKLQCANALCGFNSCVIEILEKKKYEKQKHLSNISKIHAMKYIYDGNNVSYKTWIYYGTGSGKLVTCGTEPSIPHHNVKSVFSN